jgi:hypothetical protein
MERFSIHFNIRVKQDIDQPSFIGKLEFPSLWEKRGPLNLRPRLPGSCRHSDKTEEKAGLANRLAHKY